MNIDILQTRLDNFYNLRHLLDKLEIMSMRDSYINAKDRIQWLAAY